jgi:glycosyltransferase involved in cell wall biosynthesis
MGKVIADADVMCLLSDYEAHPVAVMEALGTGTPALLADTSGLTELGEAGLATTIPVDASAGQIAAAVMTVAGSARTPPTLLPTWDDCARELKDLYLQVAR